MQYGAETRGKTYLTKSLRTTEMMTLRTITGYTLNGRQRNTIRRKVPNRRRSQIDKKNKKGIEPAWQSNYSR